MQIHLREHRGMIPESEGEPPRVFLAGSLYATICLTEAFFQTAQPRRAAQVPEGGLKPPAPLGIPCARTKPADMHFSTSPLPHSGHSGRALSVENISFSNRLWHFLHSNSYMGIISISPFRIFPKNKQAEAVRQVRFERTVGKISISAAGNF